MFTIEHYIPANDLENQIRSIPLLHHRDGQPVYPYEEANISIRELAFSDVRPTSLYVVKHLLVQQEQLANDLAVAGYDPLDLDYALLVKGNNGTTGLIPPLVEMTEADGPYILDGAHRTYRARRLGRLTFKAICIDGVRADCPAYALPNEWHEIQEYDDVPSDPTLKKHYRENYRGLYRDFSALNGARLREANNAAI